LVSLNEVGGDPARFGWPPADVYAFLGERQARHPGGLSAGSTHDTKRGEDVRTRIDVISELAGEWAGRVRRWAELNRPHKIELEDGLIAPDPNDEYLLYQTLVGAWPADADAPGVYDQFAGRVREYMVKATHEAKEHTSWINPNPEYDAAVPEFVTRVLDPARSAAFLEDLRQFRQRAARFGVFNSLAQTLLRCAAPGVPDTYQGTELWDLSLVDPDNRRPVDYPRRETLLNELDRDAEAAGENLRAFAGGLLDRAADGRVKLYVVSRALRHRRAAGDLFRDGAYQPVEASGPKADHVFAFLRQAGERAALVVVPRLTVGLVGGSERELLGPDVWADTRLTLPGGGMWVNLFTGERLVADGGLSLGQVLGHFPVALLERR
jgi:(1->4)-alpha-D-glucan 1-alpha-D-glucosylmutase